jgi:hypothetical protein
MVQKLALGNRLRVDQAASKTVVHITPGFLLRGVRLAAVHRRRIEIGKRDGNTQTANRHGSSIA